MGLWWSKRDCKGTWWVIIKRGCKGTRFVIKRECKGMYLWWGGDLRGHNDFFFKLFSPLSWFCVNRTYQTNECFNNIGRSSSILSKYDSSRNTIYKNEVYHIPRYQAFWKSQKKVCFFFIYMHYSVSDNSLKMAFKKKFN